MTDINEARGRGTLARAPRRTIPPRWNAGVWWIQLTFSVSAALAWPGAPGWAGPDTAGGPMQEMPGANSSQVPAPVPLLDQDGPSSTRAGAGSLESTIRLLFEQAAFWRGQGRQDQAAASLSRLLELDSNNSDALGMQAEIQADQGDVAGAQGTLRRLRAVRRDDPRILSVERTLRSGPIDPAQLAEARRLAQEGRKSEALALYRQFLNGDVPPPELDIEYYMLLSGVDAAGWEKARTAIAAMIAHNPQDLSLQLAYAKLLTYREATRADGIDRLQQLAQRPAIARTTRIAWRDALLWQGPDARTRDQLEAYLRDNPTDPALEAKREEIRASLPDDGLFARMRGWEAVDAHKMSVAEREFEAALAIHPDDAEAMIALATIRREQHRIAEADRLIDQAFAIAPDRRADFLVTLGGYAQSTAKSDVEGNDPVRNQYVQVGRLVDQGKYEQAEQLLRRLMGRHPNAGNYMQLGDIQARAGHLPAAEASFRQAVKMNPRSADAVLGLATVLGRAGNDQEAEALYTQARELYARAGNRVGLQALNRSRANQLSLQARRIEDPAAQISLYRDAIALDPGNPWTRLELAHALVKQGQNAEARQVMSDVTTGKSPSVEALQAGVIFAEERGDAQEMARLIDLLPARARTPHMLAAQDRLAVLAEIQQIPRNKPRAESRSRLLALAAHPDPMGYRVTEIGHALTRMNERAAVVQAVKAGLASTKPPTTEQRIAYSSTLLEAGQTQEAEAMLAGVDPQTPSAQQRTALRRLTDGLAIQQADRLNQQSRPADAYDVLAPRLAEEPHDAGLDMALARLYQNNGKASEALAISTAVLEREKDDIDVRRTVIYAAMAAGELRRADRLATEGLSLFKNDPRAYMIAADVAKARGENGRALRHLQTARELRLQQLRTDQQ